MKRLLTHSFFRISLFLFFISHFSFFTPLSAQEFVGGGKGAFEWRLIGRVFFDGGVFFNDTIDRGSSFQVNDIRLGTVVRFMDGWEAKIELGYGDSKISLKDVYLNYKCGENSFRLGYHYEPFGYARVGTSNFRFMSDATADKALGNSRKLGLSYTYNHNWLNFMGGVFSDGDIQKGKQPDQGYALAAKVVGRPLMSDRKLIHIGVAPRFSSGKDKVSFEGGVPTDLLDKADNSFLKAEVNQVTNQWKLDLELIMLYDKWYLHGQYLMAHVNRFAADNYNAKGSFLQAGYMILGAKHNYNPQTGMIVNPAPKSLELLVRYDQVNLNNAGIYGGRLSDITVGMNYFINKFVAAKINYTRMMVGETSPMGSDDLDLIQARVQLSF